jgi:hypothetical protein
VEERVQLNRIPGVSRSRAWSQLRGGGPTALPRRGGCQLRAGLQRGDVKAAARERDGRLAGRGTHLKQPIAPLELGRFDQRIEERVGIFGAGPLVKVSRRVERRA